MQLSLACLSLLEVGPTELAEIAAHTKCERVCLFVKGPHASPDSLQPVSSVAMARRVKERMDHLGLRPGTLEALIIEPKSEIRQFVETLEISQALGGHRLTALNYDPDPASAADKFSALCDLAADYGINIGLEWYRFSECGSLEAAKVLARKISRRNFTFTVDILHLIRNGGAVEDLSSIGEKIDYAQICDGSLQLSDEMHRIEAIENRGIPGEGQFPLVSFVNQLPDSAILGVEVPTNRLRGAFTPRQRAERIVNAARAVIARTRPRSH